MKKLFLLQERSHLFLLLSLAAVILAQAFFTYKSAAQIRYEEYQYKEVYYFAHNLVWDPLGAGDLGYYGTMYVFNNLFGFHLFGFKIFRLGLQFISLVFLALLLKKFLGAKNAIVPLLTIGLSSTILFFNTLQVPYGIDLQYLPIILYLFVIARERSDRGNLFYASYLIIFLTFFLIMMAWLSYPTFVFYLPILLIIFITTLRKKPKNATVVTVLIALIAFILPLVMHISWIHNRDQLIDPESGRGLFRGAGTFLVDSENFYQGLGGIVTNLFFKANSYHYEVAQVDFSGILPAIVVIFSIIISLRFFSKYKEIKMPVILLAVLAVGNITITCLSESAFNGFRKNTPLLASLYGFFVISYYLIKVKGVNFGWPKWLVPIFLGVLLVHHIVVYPFNIAQLKVPSPFIEYGWFEIEPTPKKSFELFQEKLAKEDLYLNCHQFDPSSEWCNYTDLYTALMSDCLWNKKGCREIYGFLPGYNKYYKLTPQLLQAYDHGQKLPKAP